METEQLTTVETTITTGLKLVLHNDDVNPMERVIVLLVMVMGYDAHRAEQLATLAHYRGKACIKEGGSLTELMEKQAILSSENLTVTLE